MEVDFKVEVDLKDKVDLKVEVDIHVIGNMNLYMKSVYEWRLT